MELIRWTIWTEWKIIASRRRFLNILRKAEEMWEEVECNGDISGNSNGDGLMASYLS
jgi:hypothetical protein